MNEVRVFLHKFPVLIPNQLCKGKLNVFCGPANGLIIASWNGNLSYCTYFLSSLFHLSSVDKPISRKDPPKKAILEPLPRCSPRQFKSTRETQIPSLKDFEKIGSSSQCFAKKAPSSVERKSLLPVQKKVLERLLVYLLQSPYSSFFARNTKPSFSEMTELASSINVNSGACFYSLLLFIFKLI